MKTKVVLLLLLVALLPAAVQAATDETETPKATTLVAFEYGSTADFNTAWQSDWGTPQISLANIPHGGKRSMRFDYDVTLAPYEERVRHEFAQPRNLTPYTQLSLWYQGSATSEPGDLYLALRSGEVTVLEAGFDGAHQASQTGWNRWDVDLTAATGSLASVTAIVLGVQNTGFDAGQGTVYFDDISVNNGVETVWLGGGIYWGVAANWSHGVPSSSKNARIPGQPANGNTFPRIIGGGTAVHDLTIEPGAWLHLGGEELDAVGTLINHGEIVAVDEVTANDRVTFLILGAHPGVVVETESFLISAPNAPLALAGGLGQTEVRIEGGQPCSDLPDTVQRCYVISPESTGTTAVTVTLYFAHEELNKQDCSALSAYHLHDGRWEKAGTVIDRQCDLAPYAITVSGITEFSPLALAETGPVAIGLHAFQATAVLDPLPVALLLALLGLVVLVGLITLRARRE